MTQNKKIIIAIDGHAACGKSTLAKDLAKKLKYTYIDTGAMYRAVTLYALENNIIKNNDINEELLNEKLSEINITFEYNNKTQKSETILNGKNIENKIRSSMEVAGFVSPIATIGFVRKKLVSLQQAMGKNKGIVMDGRDIGTVVFPEAELKIFLTASADIRAKRRFDELKAKGENVNYDKILNNLLERDRIDSTRKVTPLKQADDAILVDTSEMTMIGQFEYVWNLVENVRLLNC